METLIAALLYLGAMSTNIEYTETDIHQMQSRNQTALEKIEADSYQMDQADNIWDSAILIETGDKVIIVEDIDW